MDDSYNNYLEINEHEAVLEDEQVKSKGEDIKENIKRNFGMASPEGYKKALRIMAMSLKGIILDELKELMKYDIKYRSI